MSEHFVYAGGFDTGGLWPRAPKTNCIKWSAHYGDALLIWQGPLWEQHGSDYTLMQGPWEVCRVGDELVLEDGRLRIERPAESLAHDGSGTQND